MEVNTQLSKTAIIKGFNNETFQAFVWDYYLTLGNLQDDIDIEKIYQLIFDSRQNYQEFLQYCKSNDYSFVDGEKNWNLRVNIFLLAFEQAYMYITDGIKKDISSIINFGDGGVELVFANAKIPGTNDSFFSSLFKSIYHKVEVNSLGEVVYIISEFKGVYQVYSFESGIHFVDNLGNITDKYFISRRERKNTLEEIRKHTENLRLVAQNFNGDTEGPKLLELRNEYELSTGRIWEGKKIDVIQFRLWMNEKLRTQELIFQEIQIDDSRSRDNITLIGGTDTGDEEGIHADPMEVRNMKSQIGIVT